MVDTLKPNILGQPEPSELEKIEEFSAERAGGIVGPPEPETLPQDVAPDLPVNFVAEFSGMDIEEQRKLLLDPEVGNPLFQQITDPTEQTKFLNDLKEDSILVAQLFQEGKISEDSPDFNTAQQIFLAAEPYIKPAADIAALTFGGIIGAPLGTVGAVGGAGLLFGIERSFFKMVEGLLGLREPQGIVREAQEAVGDIEEGMVFESGGQLLGPVLKGGKDLVKRATGGIAEQSTLTSRGATKRASDIIEREIQGTEITQPQIDQNVKLAKELQAKIRATEEIGAEKFTFTLGQLTDDASAIALERTLARAGDIGTDLTQSQRQHAVEVLRQYYNKKVLSTGTAEDFSTYITRMESELAASTKEATDAVNSEVFRLRRHLDPQASGSSIFNKLSETRKALNDKVTELFEAIPNFKVNPEAFLDKIAKVTSERIKGEPASDFPAEAIRLIMANIKAPTKEAVKRSLITESITGSRIVEQPSSATQFITIKNLRGINRSLNGMISKASKEGNRVLARRLKILKDGFNDSLKQAELEGKGEGVEILKEANALRTSVGERFDKSTVADVFQRGARGEETRIAKANIAKEFDSLDGIDDLIAAIDSVPAARSMMKDYYAFKLVNKVVDAEGVVGRKKALNWLAENRGKLKKLGLEEEFTGLANLQTKVDEAIGKQNVFNKSVAGRILESDVDNMIANAYRGSKDIVKTTNSLLEKVKGDKAATLGLKKAFAEFLTRKVESTAPSFFQAIGGTSEADVEFLKSMSKMNKVFREFQPAIKAMYKDEPQKIQAINDMWESFRILERTAKSPIGGGSPTAELIFRGNSLGRAGGIAVGGVAPKRFYVFKVVRDWIQAFGQKNVEQYLTRAMFDPEYAAVMTREVRFGSTQAGRSTIKRLMRNGPIALFDPPKDTNRRTNR